MLAALGNLLSRRDVHLVTLTGAPGVGKTRLALELAILLRERFEDGVRLVALASVRDSRLVIPTIAQTLGLREDRDRPLHMTLKDHLQDRELLLVLDNFEQVIDAAPDVAELAGTCLQLTILVTSRAPLRVRGELEWPVPPLALPASPRPSNVEALGHSPAVALFVQRAQAVRPDFVLDERNAVSVATLCSRLDGLPLAIQLAAPWVRVLPISALADRFARRLPVLIGGGRDLPARQQTLRSAIQWSYGLLGTQPQALFRQLAVFSGGASLDAISAIFRAENSEGDMNAILLSLAELTDQSLIRAQTGTDGSPRYTMLETIREYATEQLADQDGLSEIRGRHARFFLALAEEAASRLLGPESSVWLARLECERDNLATALQWLLDGGEVEMGLRLAEALGLFWRARGYLSEGRRWLERALAVNPAAPPTLRIRALAYTGMLAAYQGDYRQAKATLEEGAALSRELGDWVCTAGVLNNLGIVQGWAGDYKSARRFVQEGLALRRAHGAPQDVPASLASLGAVLVYEGQYARAQTALEQSVSLYRKVGHEWGLAATLVDLAKAVLAQGEHRRAQSLLEEGLALNQERGERWQTAEYIEGLAAVAGIQREWLRAVRLFGAAAALRRVEGTQIPPSNRLLFDQYRTAVRDSMDELAWAAGWQEGEAMPLETAVAYALTEPAL